jgi:hypothetical protein
MKLTRKQYRALELLVTGPAGGAPVSGYSDIFDPLLEMGLVARAEMLVGRGEVYIAIRATFDALLEERPLR